jgi:diguanylate cyclase (GGDEF)-like protein
MELLLWRWSTAVQAISLAMIAVFFAVLTRSVKRADLRWWLWAWLANLAALGVTLVFWYVQPVTFVAVVRALYLAAKTGFVLLLLQGGWALRTPARVLIGRNMLLALALYALAGGVLLESVEALGIAQHATMGLLLVFGGLSLRRENGLTWFAFGLLVRATLSIIEACAYGLGLLPGAGATQSLQQLTGTFLAASSSFDSGTEWLIALGCVLTLSERAQRELRDANTGLLAAHEDLRRLADRDPLTGLANRRGLPEILRAMHGQGATLLFFDLDGFKEVNDRYGHAVGDDCLKRFAAALLESFRPSDSIVRYAGDEFVVVASGLDGAAVAERIDALRERLRFLSVSGAKIAFSVGVSELTPGGQPELALQAADRSMYAAKTARRP